MTLGALMLRRREVGTDNVYSETQEVTVVHTMSH